ncbi:putative rRNA maturation factor [Lachnotalea glycerini]|jgi:probable rRNA maturation factor|uniref:Endoribonuclease YbeY n=1 Tax=Lachnotalea glycerini TaxID=1763509 RepID=A0A255IM81_9FIRM|nr:rRNA maturation RNase YbeY [Lachnotalea glycerini]PXV95466.1 putative rRNA maturation factor [Lachnotalea glycerini]RDY32787.1 rRNA maturation RNase YbeY [Lachnotalea glycerini]
MTFNIEVETKKQLSFDYKKIIDEVINKVLEFENCPYETEVNLVLTDDEEIHSINMEYRGIDSPTDVLSFPMIDYISPSDFSIVEKNEREYFNPETGELILGDIIISVDKVYEQAKCYNHSDVREFAFLITHSMLHLCGYDHMEKAEANIMEEKQSQILSELGINR